MTHLIIMFVCRIVLTVYPFNNRVACRVILIVVYMVRVRVYVPDMFNNRVVFVFILIVSCHKRADLNTAYEHKLPSLIIPVKIRHFITIEIHLLLRERVIIVG